MKNAAYKYTCIFGGGAIRGVAYVGALKALDELGVEIQTLAGSSVGSIIASLLAVGYTTDDIYEIIIGVNFDVFIDIHFGFGKTFAHSKGEGFLEWLREVIEKKFYGENYKKGENPSVKFKDLDKDLVIITTDLTNFKCKEFSKQETPDFEVATAVRISSSMPGLMSPIRYEDLELFDVDLQKSWPLLKLSENLYPKNERVLEFRLEGDYDRNGKNAIDFINTVYSCVTSIATKSVVEEYGHKDSFDYVTINTGDIVIVDFNLSKNKREELIYAGYKQTLEYFKQELPIKKEKLSTDYKNIYLLIKNLTHELGVGNIQKAKNFLGEIYMELCEVKDNIDKKYYKKLQSAKFRFMNELKPSLILKRYNKDSVKSVREDFKQIEDAIKNRIDELEKLSKELNKTVYLFI